jgi:nucleoside-diphosphate-sugar epimerase
MTIAVTGGTGFLGSRVVAELLARGHHVRCLIRSARKGAELSGQLTPERRSRLQFVQGHLERVDSCRDVLRHSETVVHVAAPLTGSVGSLFASGVIPTRVLANAAVDQGVRRFVLVSSLAVYGSQHLAPGEVLDERCSIDRHPHLRDPYTYSKIAQEEACWQAHSSRGLPLVVVRPGVLFGPGRPLLTPRIGLMVGGVLIQMDGRQRVPYCFVDNCARAVVLAAEVAGVDGMSFNTLDDDLPSANRVLKLHRKHVSSVRAIRIPRWAVSRLARACEWYSDRSSGMFPPVLTPYKAAALWKRLRYSNELAKTRLGWRPFVTFDDGVRRTVDARSMSDPTPGN